MSRVGRLLAAATLVGGLIASASPAMAARPGTFNFDACWDGSQVVASLSWSGVRVANYAFSTGTNDGNGFGYLAPVDPPSTSGNATIDPDFATNIDDSMDLVGGDVYGKGTRRAIFSDTVQRPGATWADLDAC